MSGAKLCVTVYVSTGEYHLIAELQCRLCYPRVPDLEHLLESIFPRLAISKGPTSSFLDVLVKLCADNSDLQINVHTIEFIFCFLGRHQGSLTGLLDMFYAFYVKRTLWIKTKWCR